VDTIFASHTLGRWIGQVEGTPVVQPWPFGAELGVIELEVGEDPRTYCVTPETGGRWGGAGGELLADASSKVLGELAEPMSSRSGGPAPLADFFARALREATGAHAAALDMLASQAPVDGVLSYLPAGPVSEATSCASTPGPTPPSPARSERKSSGRWLKRRGRGRCGASTPRTDRTEDPRPSQSWRATQ
jgi:hypothetical protein